MQPGIKLNNSQALQGAVYIPLFPPRDYPEIIFFNTHSDEGGTEEVNDRTFHFE